MQIELFIIKIYERDQVKRQEILLYVSEILSRTEASIGCLVRTRGEAIFSESIDLKKSLTKKKCKKGYEKHGTFK